VSCAGPSPVSFLLDRLAVAEAEPSTEVLQRRQLGSVQAAHLPHEAGHVPGKDRGDQPAAPLGQRDHDEAAIVATALLRHQPPAHEVADHHRGVAIAAQQLLAELALAERAVMQQRLQHAELPDGEPGLRHHAADAGRDRLGRPHQLDVGVEGGGLGRRARVAGRHRSNLNGL
jgi:hypothetical protein